jgi:ABC-type sugar transport system substrate-binding protein
VLLLLKTLDNPFFVEIERGFREDWKQPNVSVEVRAGKNEGDTGAQRQLLESFFVQHVKGRKNPTLRGVVLTPSGSSGELADYIKPFRDAHIPIILLDTGIDRKTLEQVGTNYNLLFASDNSQGGEAAATVLLEKLNLTASIKLCA